MVHLDLLGSFAFILPQYCVMSQIVTVELHDLSTACFDTLNDFVLSWMVGNFRLKI